MFRIRCSGDGSSFLDGNRVADIGQSWIRDDILSHLEYKGNQLLSLGNFPYTESFLSGEIEAQSFLHSYVSIVDLKEHSEPFMQYTPMC